MYEIVFALEKKTDYPSRIELCSNLAKTIINQGGVLTSIQYLGLQPFYFNKKAIRDQEKGKYVTIKGNMSPSTLSRVTYDLNQNDSVVRSMAIKC